MATTDAAAKVQPINKLFTAADLNAKYDSLKRGRQFQEAAWKLALAFYKGKQYTYYNKTTRRLESLPVEDGEKPRYRVRIVNNQIMTGAHALLAKYTKTKPIINATPTSGSDSDLKAAQVADKLLQHLWEELDLDDKLAEALLWGIITGQGYWKITWDANAGEKMRFMLGPDGKPIVDTALEDLFRNMLAQQGINAQERVVFQGEIDVQVPSPFDVFLDPSARVFDDCQYAFCDHYMTPEEIKAKWDIEVKADSTADTPDVLLPYSANKLAEVSVRAVHVGYFKPSATIPNGRYVTWVDQKIVDDQPWPYPFNDLPLIKFPGVRVPGSIYDASVVEQAIPLQKDLNRTLSQIVEYKNLTLKPRIWTPTGSLNGTRITSEPGVIIEYNPIGDHRPVVEQLPAMPPYVFEHLTNIKTSLKEVFGIAEITEGTPPPNVEAGIAIDLLQEMATDRLAPTIVLIEHALGDAGELILQYAQKYYAEPRTLKINGSGGTSQVKRFTQADLQGGVSVSVEAGSALPRTRAGRQARILDYIDRGVISPQAAYKYLDIADLEGLAGKFRANDDQAYREHDKLIAGQPINVPAMQQAQQQVQSSMQSGQPLTDDNGQPVQDPQQFIQSAANKPFIFEDYQTHMDIHALFMVSPEFEGLPPEIQAQFIDHYTQTLTTWIRLPKPVEYKAVNPSLQIKGTVGPTIASEIMQRAGLFDVTPEQFTEPPLETWVSDKVDEPNLSDTAQAHVTAKDIQLKEMELSTKAVAGAQANANTALTAVHSHQSAEATHAIEGHKIAEAKAKADLAKKKLAQSNFKPKPRPKGK